MYFKLSGDQLISGDLTELFPNTSFSGQPDVRTVQELGGIVYDVPPNQRLVSYEVVDGAPVFVTEEITFVPFADWRGFIQEFLIPGQDTTYDLVASKVQQSTAKTQEHWANIRIGLATFEIRSIEWFENSWNYLKYLLIIDGNPLSETEISRIETVARNYHLLFDSLEH